MYAAQIQFFEASCTLFIFLIWFQKKIAIGLIKKVINGDLINYWYTGQISMIVVKNLSNSQEYLADEVLPK